MDSEEPSLAPQWLRASHTNDEARLKRDGSTRLGGFGSTGAGDTHGASSTARTRQQPQPEPNLTRRFSVPSSSGSYNSTNTFERTRSARSGYGFHREDREDSLGGGERPGSGTVGYRPPNRGGAGGPLSARGRSGDLGHSRDLHFGDKDVNGRLETRSSNYSSTRVSVDTPKPVSALSKQVSFDKDFPTLGAKPKAVSITSFGAVTPKPWESPTSPLSIASLGEQQWTSKLAEAPRVEQPSVQPNGLAASAKAAVATPTRQAPQRMADALQQAVERVPAQQAASDRQRLDERAIRQSKQLIPMVSSTASKASKSSSKPGSGPLLTAKSADAGLLLRNRVGAVPPAAAATGGAAPGGTQSGLGTLGTLPKRAVPGLAERSGSALLQPAAAAVAGSQAVSTPRGGGLGQQQTAAGVAVPGQQPGAAAKPAGGPSAPQRNRNSFFQSLKKKSAAAASGSSDKPKDGSESGTAEPTSPVAAGGAEKAGGDLGCGGGGVKDAEKHAEGAAGALNGGGACGQKGSPALNGGQNGFADAASQLVSEVGSHDQGSNGVDAGRRDSLDANDPRLQISEEERSFLISLGWDGDADDEADGEGGLTEEEIAAFKAESEKLGRQSSGLAIPILLSQRSLARPAIPEQVVGSYGISEVSSSDSDSD